MLMRVEDGAFSSRLLADSGSSAVRVRVLEVLRSLRALDTVLAQYLQRDLDELDAEVRVALRMGLAEAIRLAMPPPLATDGAVRLVRRLGKSSASGMVNAVLRKASSGARETLGGSPVDVRLSHPGWLYRRWVDHFGNQAAEAAMASAQEPAQTWAWFLDDQARHELVGAGTMLDGHPWCPGAWSAQAQPGRLLEAVANGAAYAQDPSSQVVAHVANSLGGATGSFIDLCAAPGGKTALLLVHGDWTCAVAADRRLSRTRLMHPLLDRAGECTIIAADATMPSVPGNRWDLVLIDAPCTGTGTFRRHPELKWRLSRESINQMAEQQREILLRGLDLVAPRGTLLFSTCSVEPEENEGLFEDLPEEFDTADIEPHLPAGMPRISTAAGGIRILPNPLGDGFTMHAVRRVG
jgi:16S rRNA (cytosine967-C5)-methyltransferase